MSVQDDYDAIESTNKPRALCVNDVLKGEASGNFYLLARVGESRVQLVRPFVTSFVAALDAVAANVYRLTRREAETVCGGPGSLSNYSLVGNATDIFNAEG